jgi:hypothetical protein
MLKIGHSKIAVRSKASIPRWGLYCHRASRRYERKVNKNVIGIVCTDLLQRDDKSQTNKFNQWQSVPN